MLLGLVAVAAILLGKFVMGLNLATYGGGALLAIAATWSLVAKRSAAAAAGGLNRLRSVKRDDMPGVLGQGRACVDERFRRQTSQSQSPVEQAQVIADQWVTPTQLVNAVQKAGFHAEVSNPAPTLRMSDTTVNRLGIFCGGTEMVPTTEETRVIEILLEDWRDLLRCTTIDQAMERVGMPFSHVSRLRIAHFLIGDPAASNLMRWDPPAYVLTNDEKLIARRVVRLWRQGMALPPPGADEWRHSGRRAAQIEAAFNVLAWLGFMRQVGDRYEVAEDPEVFLRGLGFYFHEVVLPERGERFHTNCAPDFFILTSRPVRERALAGVSERVRSAPAEGLSEKMRDAILGVNTAGARPVQEAGFYGDERAMLHDACAWSDEPIRVVMDHGKLVEVTPVTSWYLRGGG